MISSMKDFSEVKNMKTMKMAPKEMAKKMPPLKLEKARRWLARREVIEKMVFNSAVDNGLIVYDEKTRTWRGVDYED